MKKINLLDVAAILIWLLPIAYIAYIYQSLPVSVPIHFGADGKPNQYMEHRGEFLGTQAIVLWR